jgi:hypothetical protein
MDADEHGFVERWLQSRCGWGYLLDDDPGQIVPRKQLLWMFHSSTTRDNLLLHMQQKVALRFLKLPAMLLPCNPRPKNS